ncbi:coenzyme F420-0:L-glutamate ligase [Citroniella saccharovorans]|uniref:Coenzyme F420-0:L-glutamate ligase n=1 Tax=Citroniella saccharovorans TaxID=2053367 RepID=A0AAW9MPW4_9FIRM|nr:coenzyme F420-0:L-glutamate ligase [Citroniella saccharovorans]MEB3429111.1 coenzyme F420-0:L-glutamate ligase [Citroniella saccharovorans]
MQRTIGTSAYGLRAPIIKSGDCLKDIVVESLDEAVKENSFKLREKDVLAITESLLARSQGNYASVDDITKDLNEKFDDEIAVVFPITSRNRFSVVLKAIANTKKKISIFLTYPQDEVGNRIIDTETLLKNKINTYKTTLTEEDYIKLVGGEYKHPFTGVDYIKFYKNFAINDNIKIYLTNDPLEVLKYSKSVLIANIHDRNYLKELYKEHGAEKIYGLDDILTSPVNGSGYNKDFGLYGSNMATENSIKLFPRNCQEFVEDLQKMIKDKFGVKIEVMVYGDGAFKDPVGKIWELADPVVSPGYTSGLVGTPNELKLKYIADTDLKDLSKDEALKAMKDKIAAKENSNKGQMNLGTTPRNLTDLLGSLADLISGSGDKGTPIVLIKGYFDNLATE